MGGGATENETLGRPFVFGPCSESISFGRNYDFVRSNVDNNNNAADRVVKTLFGPNIHVPAVVFGKTVGGRSPGDGRFLFGGLACLFVPMKTTL